MRFAEENILAPRLTGPFDLVRVANLLNLDYFAPDQVRARSPPWARAWPTGGSCSLPQRGLAAAQPRDAVRRRGAELEVVLRIRGGSEKSTELVSAPVLANEGTPASGFLHRARSSPRPPPEELHHEIRPASALPTDNEASFRRGLAAPRRGIARPRGRRTHVRPGSSRVRERARSHVHDSRRRVQLPLWGQPRSPRPTTSPPAGSAWARLPEPSAPRAACTVRRLHPHRGRGRSTPVSFNARIHLVGLMEFWWSRHGPPGVAQSRAVSRARQGTPRWCSGRGAASPCRAVDVTLSVPLTRPAGVPFTIVYELISGAFLRGSSAHGVARFDFTGLPPGVAIQSCRGYTQDTATPARPTSWGALKSRYR